MERDYWPGNVGERELDAMASGPSILILGDPADLYVCSDAACEPDEYVMFKSAWRASLWNTTIVTGSTAPREVDPATREAIIDLRFAHIRATLAPNPLGYYYATELDYHQDTIDALGMAEAR